jgi:hypothetical protein
MVCDATARDCRLLRHTRLRSVSADPGDDRRNRHGSRRSAVPGAPVQAKNPQAEAAFKAISSAQGQYSLTGLPAGAYDLSVKMPGFRFAPFVKPGVALESSQNLRIDIRLPDGNLGTLGDDPFSDLAFIRARVERLSGPVPRTADRKPDLSGLWIGNDDPFPEDAAALPWAAALFRERVQNNMKHIPRTHCLPAGVLPTGPFFRKFVQTPGLLLMINDNDVLGFRQIFLDGRGHPKDLNPTWNGHAIGRWEGDTLVVDVAGFNDRSWLGFYPHTEQLHITERYRRRDFGHLEVQVIAEDPGTLVKPWKLNMVWNLAPEEEILEYVCGENNTDVQHLVGK